MNIIRRHLLGGAAAALAASPAVAQGWAPTRPIRFVVPFAAGGATDVVARVVADRMAERLGQPVVVENRAGSGGNIGVENVVRAPADGSVILMGTTGTLTINQHLYGNMGFDPAKDLAPVGMAFATDHVLIVNPNVPAQTAQEFLAWLRANPGKASFGSAGSGSSTHMVAELFRAASKVEVTHVPYRGSAPALNDTVAGNVQFMLDQLPSAIGQIQGGRVKALATTGPKRTSQLPDVPTMAEIGLPNAEATSWGAIMVPAGTPAPVIARLNAVLNEALADPKIQERLKAAGADAVSSSPEELQRKIAQETETWGAVVRDARITVN
ncbi:Bug family tripartite tricarboxylate transporter substrate binding protein [Roseomonas xinghualingensis]|uniref:Bug family tripartite tricarboxylate transporter substrate binding protein n=1 Tax=Roseomonas xinghualingensis TaxID=2986475 RepID=UPI0021F0D883|nr:tripartite tricarboxylate transporter substrate binding protein [Roseomonas sp. SXEYE001]MCV4209024.1 tripartite tricarboxylate transporter substrate binding protein [Roseomonas sp. SXEYE001]